MSSRSKVTGFPEITSSSRIDRSAEELPISDGRFVGRNQKISELTHHIHQSGGRVLSVVGGPGVGKSRLVLESLRRGSFSDVGSRKSVIRWIDLGTIESRSQIFAALNGVFLGDVDGSESDFWTHYSTLNSASTVILVLDNAEGHLSVLREILPSLCRSGSRLHVVVTSRLPLDLVFEQLFELPTLSLSSSDGETAVLSEAVALFVERANRRRTVIEPGRNREILDEIVALLDGLPLAIDLSASRCEVLSLEQLRDRLKRDLLSTVASTAHQTRFSSLEASLRWSWQLLDPFQRSALAQCAVFECDFTVEAAEGIIAFSEEEQAPSILDIIQRLREACLLVPAEGGGGHQKRRLRLLASVRAFALLELGRSGEQSDVRLRHLSWYAHKADELREGAYGFHDGVLRSWVMAEKNNLTAAFSWSLGFPDTDSETALLGLMAVMPVWKLQQLPATKTQTQQMLSHIDRVSDRHPKMAAEALSLCITRLMRGNPSAAAGAVARGISLAESLDDSALQGRLRVNETWLHLYNLDYDAAAVSSLQARSLIGAEANPYTLSSWYVTEGSRLISIDREDEALELLSEGREFARRVFAHGDEVQLLGRLGKIHAERGEVATSAYFVREYRTLCQRLNRPSLECRGMQFEALIHLDAGHLRKAEAVANELIEQADRLQHWLSLPDGWTILGLIKHEQGDVGAAEAWLHKAMNAYERWGWVARLGECCLSLAAVQADLNRLAICKTLLTRAASLSHGGGAVEKLCYSIQECHLLLGQARKATADSERFESLVAEVRTRLSQAVQPDSAGGTSPSSRSLRGRRAVRLAERSLRRTLEMFPQEQGHVLSSKATMANEHPIMDREGHRFRLPGQQWVDLKGKRTLRLLLARLVEAYLVSPGRPLTVDDMLKAGWPGERVLADSGRSRVRVAVFHLRDLGLRDLLLTESGGYLLDPDVEIEVN